MTPVSSSIMALICFALAALNAAQAYRAGRGVPQLLFTVLALGYACLGYLFLPTWDRPSPCRTFHARAGSACPPGSERLADFFTEDDGRTVDACTKPDGEPCIDELRAGESFGMHLELPPEPCDPGVPL